MIKVFISSPYSGNEEENVNIQQRCANDLINLGFNPFIPLLYHYQEAKFPHPYNKWLELDTDWISVCDVLLRLPGESPGADDEVKHAQKLNIPVVNSVEELKIKYGIKQYRYVSTIDDLRENDYDILKEYVKRPTHIITEVHDSTMAFEDGSEAPFGQFKSFYNYEGDYLLNETSSCCPNSNVVVFSKQFINDIKFGEKFLSTTSKIIKNDMYFKFHDYRTKHDIMVDKRTVDKFIDILETEK